MTITGTGFGGATHVSFGGVSAKTFTLVSTTEITAVSPPQTAGLRDIRVTTADGGISRAVSGDRFSVVKPPAVTRISPTSGSVRGGTTVTITGTGFSAGTAVSFGGNAARRFRLVSATKITAVSPSEKAGVRNICVTTTYGGTSRTVTADRFTYK